MLFQFPISSNVGFELVARLKSGYGIDSMNFMVASEKLVKSSAKLEKASPNAAALTEAFFEFLKESAQWSTFLWALEMSRLEDSSRASPASVEGAYFLQGLQCIAGDLSIHS